jgi:type III restriction enzyme
MGLKNIMVINDEAHHCYRERPKVDEDAAEKLRGEEKAEAEENNEAARWQTDSRKCHVNWAFLELRDPFGMEKEFGDRWRKG